jgi:hypothetical protein
MACDNKAVVHQVHKFLPTKNTSTTPAMVNPAEVYLHPLSAEWDVLIEIYHTVRTTWLATTIEHIKGHQDDDKPVSQLSLLARLNIEADQLASTHQRRHPEPAPRARLLRHTGVHLHLPTGTVTSRYDQTLRQAYTAPLSISYLQERFSWTPAVFMTIHWDAHGKALQRQRSHHVHFTKLVYDILPTNRVQHRHNNNISPLCPCCNAVEETRDHLLRCPETETWRRELVGVLRTRCDELHTSPRLRDYLLQSLQDWLAHGDHMPTGAYPLVFKPITDTQTAIGWQHLFSARFSMEWATAQSCYLEQRQLLEPTSAGDRWVVEISTMIWNKWRELWQHRNSIVHGKDADDQRHIQRTQLERRIHQVYAQQNKVEPSMAPVFAQPEHTYVGKGNIHMSNWLAVHEIAVLDSVTWATKRAIQGMRSILTYFGKDKGAETG